MPSTLKESLRNWTDIDMAEFHLACALGLMDESTCFGTRAKHVFWSSNDLGNFLHTMLMNLRTLGILEEDDCSRVRWNQAFKGTWEQDVVR
jgi:hypothetical protein